MNAESVKARLKNFAKCTGYTFQEALTYYGLGQMVQGGEWQSSPPSYSAPRDVFA